jgi:hypothetical protein
LPSFACTRYCCCHNGPYSLLPTLSVVDSPPSPLPPDVAFTCRRQLHSFQSCRLKRSFTPSVHLLLLLQGKRVVHCKLLATTPTSLHLAITLARLELTQHLLRDCSPLITTPRALGLSSPFVFRIAWPEVSDTLAIALSSSPHDVHRSRHRAILLTQHHTLCPVKPYSWLPTSE